MGNQRLVDAGQHPMKGLSDDDMLSLAAGTALRKDDCRSFKLGAVGVRNDGTVVYSLNGPAPNKCAQVHAEARLCHKLTPGSTVWVARIRHDGTLGMARPCPSCQRRLRSSGVDRVIYTISDHEHGVINMSKGTEIARPSRGARKDRNKA
jgi:tRNA(Arg) A34 adenosine deaminase TadA